MAEEDDVGEDYNPEEEVDGDYKVKGIDLPELKCLLTGEEDEDEITSIKTKLYRFRSK